MLPLAQLPTDGIRGIFTDIDGTLTDDGVLHPEAYRAICDAAAAGLRVVLVTGRPGGYAEVLAALWPVDAAIAENGALAVLRGGAVRFWDAAEVRSEQRRRLDALVADALAALPFARLADDGGLRRVDVAFDIGERQSLAPEQVDALVALMRKHGASTLCSTIHAHGFYGDHDKARMLVRVAAELWGEPEALVRSSYVFVGDSPNDQAGFTAFARSVGVANVERFVPQLAPPPAYVTALPGGRGFAEVVARLIHA